VSDFCAESAVVHKENIKIFDVVDCEFFKTVGKEELGGVV
jgi:hypothetical protein